MHPDFCPPSAMKYLLHNIFTSWIIWEYFPVYRTQSVHSGGASSLALGLPVPPHLLKPVGRELFLSEFVFFFLQDFTNVTMKVSSAGVKSRTCLGCCPGLSSCCCVGLHCRSGILFMNQDSQDEQSCRFSSAVRVGLLWGSVINCDNQIPAAVICDRTLHTAVLLRTFHSYVSAISHVQLILGEQAAVG